MAFSTNLSMMTKLYVTPATIFGMTVGGINIYNMKLSPVYKPNDQFNNIRIVGMSGIKGFIYGLCIPFSPIGIVLDLESEKRFKNHFIPFSKYYNK